MASATDVLKVFSHYHKRTVVLSSGAISGYGDVGSAWGSNSPYAEFAGSPVEMVPNTGGPFTETTSWVGTLATVDLVGSELRVTAAAAASSTGTTVTIPQVVTGRSYRVVFTGLRASVGNSAGARFRLKDVTAGLYREGYEVTPGNSRSQTFTFVATSNNYQIEVAPASIAAWGSPGDTAFISFVSIKPV